MDNKLIDISVSLYFEVKDAAIFGGEGSVGYTSTTFRHCGAEFIPATEESINAFVSGQIEAAAHLCSVTPDKVQAIPYEVYDEAVDDDCEEDDDEDCIPQF